MKNLWLLSVSIFFFSCNDHRQESASSTSPVPANLSPAVLPASPDDAKIIVHEEEGDTLSFTKQQLKEILSAYPLLASTEPVHPDSIYQASIPLPKDDSARWIHFGGEQSYDDFYCVYGYFMKQQAGDEEHEAERKDLIAIYRVLNDLFGDLNYGGTYYGHQYRRIIGYAEFDLHRKRRYPELYTLNSRFNPVKFQFLDTLRQIIRAGMEDDAVFQWSAASEKTERKKQLFGYIEQLDKMITNDFYLSGTIGFWKSNYDF